jgi:hypothetical protein
MADKYLYGNGDFAILVGVTTPPASETDYDAAAASYGNLKKLKISPKVEYAPHYKSVSGLKKKDANRPKQAELNYTATVENFDSKLIKSIYFATQGTDQAPAGEVPGYETFTPLAAPSGLTGMCRIRMWDTTDTAHPKIVHKDFIATVRCTSEPEIGDDYASVELNIEVLDTVGKVLLKKDAA